MTTAFETRLDLRLQRKSAQYPRISEARDMRPQWTKRGPTCAYCEDHATHRITLQLNHLRAEDETRDVCEAHSQELPQGATA